MIDTIRWIKRRMAIKQRWDHACSEIPRLRQAAREAGITDQLFEAAISNLKFLEDWSQVNIDPPKKRDVAAYFGAEMKELEGVIMKRNLPGAKSQKNPKLEDVAINEYLDLLGLECVDAVTEFTGVVTSISFDLYGCIQAVVNPGLDDKGAPMESLWFDVGRLQIVRPTPVMTRPHFTGGPAARGLKGPENKPAMSKP